MNDADADWKMLDTALDRALALDDPERSAYLAGLDEGLQHAVQQLLYDALNESDTLLTGRKQFRTLLLDLESTVGAGTRIGAYELETLVGEGGMGRVYRARRVDGAYEQTVAIKIVRKTLMLAGDDVSARLRRERAVLATLNHPNIARLLDGGTTDDGVPYLVTEFVDGSTITQWCKTHHVALRERIALVIQVARAVDHAHRRLVVHRDLKPSNVLVTERDGTSWPIVLDFGIAKLIDDADGDMITQMGARPLTPAYAAPELLDTSAAVTTAADVYGLGALLYELITEAPPQASVSAEQQSDTASRNHMARASGRSTHHLPQSSPPRPRA